MISQTNKQNSKNVDEQKNVVSAREVEIQKFESGVKGFLDFLENSNHQDKAA